MRGGRINWLLVTKGTGCWLLVTEKLLVDSSSLSFGTRICKVNSEAAVPLAEAAAFTAASVPTTNNQFL
jgi:hypothetical protein